MPASEDEHMPVTDEFDYLLVALLNGGWRVSSDRIGFLRPTRATYIVTFFVAYLRRLDSQAYTVHDQSLGAG